jgi:hypothetical protein
MGVFGQNESGSPLGAIDPLKVFDFSGMGFYDYSGFSSRVGDLGISGFSMAASAISCQIPGLELIPWAPTLVFPLAFDVVSGITEAEWREADPRDSCDEAGVTYEVQFTASFSRGDGWRTLSVGIPTGTTSLPIDFSLIPHTEDAGIRVRGKDKHGIYSLWSTSINPFTVENHPPNPVRIRYPRDVGEEFDNELPVLWEEPVVADIDGHDVTYVVEVTSNFGNDTGWTVVPGAEALPRGINAFPINTFEFPEGSDYGVRIVPVDELGARGTPTSVQFAIRHPGSFIIDTLPPEGRVVVNDGATITSDPRVKLEFFGEDETTGIKDFRVRNADETCWSDWDVFVPQRFWDMSGTDGLKRILVQFRDYAGNVSEACDCEVVAKVFCRSGNVTDLQSSPQKLFASFDQEGRVTGYTVVADDVATLPQPEVTALAFLDKDLYAAAYDSSSDITTIHRIRGSDVVSITVVAGKVLSMSSFLSGIYVGLQSGFIKEILGSGIQFPSPGDPALSPVTKLKITGALLLGAAGQKYVTYNGVTWQENEL